MSDRRKTKRGGFYWKDGKPYISVTRVISVIDKPALRYWFGIKVWEAMVKDPTLDQKEALRTPYTESGKARERGSTVHSIVEAWKQSQKAVDTVPEKFRGYAQAFYDWVKDNKITIIAHERSVFSDKYGYAGTLDLLVKMNGNDKLVVVDVKTSKGGAIYPEAEIQLSAYIQALQENGVQAADGMVVALSETGKYATKKIDYRFDVFLACKKIYEWQNKDLLASLRKGAK